VALRHPRTRRGRPSVRSSGIGNVQNGSARSNTAAICSTARADSGIWRRDGRGHQARPRVCPLRLARIEPSPSPPSLSRVRPTTLQSRRPRRDAFDLKTAMSRRLAARCSRTQPRAARALEPSRGHPAESARSGQPIEQGLRLPIETNKGRAIENDIGELTGGPVVRPGRRE